ncbi:inhibitory synaptic factor 2A-like [Sceloporus undulatus]|uniref:inhibitory synaptic factor 2A-like n=1 Tax=Sceloporus undulatus TaxID=8520 RepID=UPI001C4DCEFB|nr:inhibitory synaptic factor 2A-like [Sceloporus undulatus]XP_042322910.1 inhibitory synaptic factor 2A-like [Sceloporus undulatus]
MVSKEEVGPNLAPPAAAPEEKAVTVRSVLRRHGGLDVEGRLQRRQSHPHQVRFKGLEDYGEETPVHNTACASATPKLWGANPARRSWPQAEPHLLTPQPPPHKGCASTAIQTSPGLQRPSWGTPLRSLSVCGCMHQGGSGQVLPLWGPTASLSTHNQPPASSLPQLCPKTHATRCPVRPPLLRCPCTPYLGQEPCLLTSLPSQHRPCAPSLRSPCNPSAPWPGPPTMQTNQSAPKRTSPGAPQQGSPPPYPFAQGAFQRDCLPSPPSFGNTSLWGAAPQLPHSVPSTSATSRKPPSSSQESLGSAQLPQQATCLPPEACQSSCPGHRGLRLPRALCHEPLARDCLSPAQARAVHHVQGLLQLVPMGKGPAEEEEHPPAASQDPARSVGDVQSQLQSLEGVLETSQQTIRLLLGVIQDLDRKEAQQDGCCSSRRGQDRPSAGTALASFTAWSRTSGSRRGASGEC